MIVSSQSSEWDGLQHQVCKLPC